MEQRACHVEKPEGEERRTTGAKFRALARHVSGKIRWDWGIPILLLSLHCCKTRQCEGALYLSEPQQKAGLALCS